MNRVTLNHHAFTLALDHKKRLINPLTSMIFVLILAITGILLSLFFMNQHVFAAPASHSSVFVIQDDDYVETLPTLGRPDLSQTFPIINSNSNPNSNSNQTSPSFALWHPYGQHDEWRLVYFGSPPDGLHQQHDVDFTITPIDKGVVIAEPKESLQTGTYCFYQRDWFDRPPPTAHHCFEIEDVSS